MNEGRLFKKDSKGKLRFWEVDQYVDPVTDKFMLCTRTGIVGEMAKKSFKEVKDNKAGTGADRAPGLVETQYKNKMRSGGYFPTAKAARDEKKPLVKMLAKDLVEDDIEKLPDDFFPCFGQIKLNGLAGTWHKDRDALMSRSMIPHDKMQSLANEIRSMGYRFIDCELYTPGFLVSDISSMVSNGDKRIGAYIFDVPRDDDSPFSKRMEDLMKIKCHNVSPRIFTVATIRLENRDEVMKFYAAAIANNDNLPPRQRVEGIILRPADGVYKWNNKTTRGRDLMKVKPPEDAEFEVVEIICDEKFIDGLKQKLIKFVCKTDKGLTFKWTPSSMGHDKRIQMYQQFLDGDIDPLTLPPASLTFREYTKTGKPFHIMDGYLREIM